MIALVFAAQRRYLDGLVKCGSSVGLGCLHPEQLYFARCMLITSVSGPKNAITTTKCRQFVSFFAPNIWQITVSDFTMVPVNFSSCERHCCQCSIVLIAFPVHHFKPIDDDVAITSYSACKSINSSGQISMLISTWTPYQKTDNQLQNTAAGINIWNSY